MLAATVAGFGVAASAGASGTPWITRTTARAAAPTSSSPSLPQGAFYIYDNLGVGNAYSCCIGWAVSEPGGGGSYTSAMSFTPSSSAQVTEIDLALSHSSGTNNATIELARDNGGTRAQSSARGAWPANRRSVPAAR